MSDGGDEQDVEDDLSRRLGAIADALEQRYGAAVHVERPDPGETEIRPASGGGIPVEWSDDGPGTPLVYITVGNHSFSLHRDAESVDYIEDIATAAVSGRIVETVGIGRSSLTIPTRNGSDAKETGIGFPLGLLPLPRRFRGERTVTHPPYRLPGDG